MIFYNHLFNKLEIFVNHAIIKIILMLICSNVFMSFAWYSHLKNQAHTPLITAIITSWLIAFLEYCIAVPANRIGHTAGLQTAQLKIIQEAVTLLVFIPFYTLYMQESFSWNYVWAVCCIMGAVYFIFK